MAEQNTEQTVMVRQVTDVHYNWSYPEKLEHGKSSYQLILDDGAQQVLIMPTAEDGKLLRDLINDADALYWDIQNEVLIFGTVK